MKILNSNLKKEKKGHYLYVKNTDGREGMKSILIKPKKESQQGGWENQLRLKHLHKKLTIEDVIKEISKLLLKEYRKGYNAAIKDFKIKNDFGEKSL